MATFKFGRYIDIHWNGYDIQGPADTIFSIPDQLYEEFNDDIAPVEPTLQWIDANEFQTLKDSVVTSVVIGSGFITTQNTTSGTVISIDSKTSANGTVLTANGSGGVTFSPISSSIVTSIIGVSPISSLVSGGTVSVSLNASYQTAGTYVNAVIGTSPASVVTSSGTSTVSIDQAAITGATAADNAQTVRTYVKNTTGTTIPKGSAVYVSGSTGDNALISLATASTEAGSSKTLGITSESIANDAFGYVVESGYLTGIDTTGVTAGTSVWLGNTLGSLTFGSPPSEPSNSVYLGVVIREQQNNGSILVKVQNGYELDELHDVSAASPTDLDILQYKTSSAMWTKASIANAGIAASTHTHAYISSVIGTSPLSVSTSSGTATISIASAGTATVGAVQLTDSTSSTSTTTAATPNSVKIAYDLAAAAVPSNNHNISMGFTSTSVETISRAYASFVNVNLTTSGRALFAMVRPVKDLTVGNASVHCVGAGTSMTVARLGLYTWNDSSGTATLVAQTANDTTIFGTANTLQSRAFDTAGGYPATYTMLAGSAYAFALVCVGTGTMPFVGGLSTNAVLTFASPRIFGILTGQTDLPATTSSLASTTQGVWGRFS